MRLKFIKKIIAILVIFFTISCSKNESSLLEETTVIKLSKEEINKALELDIDPNRLELFTSKNLGEVEEEYISLGDITFSRDQFLKLPTDLNEDVKLWRTNNIINLINGNVRVINIFAYTGALVNNVEIGLSRNAQRGLRDAVSNWNSLRAGFNFNITFGTNFNTRPDNTDVLVFCQTNLNSFARALFPSNGLPGRNLWISQDANDDNGNNLRNRMEAMFTHELGHIIGLRHSDWGDRQSCQDPDLRFRETPRPIHIPDTAQEVVDDPDSIMNACWDFDTNGELTQKDRNGVLLLYPAPVQ